MKDVCINVKSSNLENLSLKLDDACFTDTDTKFKTLKENLPPSLWRYMILPLSKQQSEIQHAVNTNLSNSIQRVSIPVHYQLLLDYVVARCIRSSLVVISFFMGLVWIVIFT